MQVTSTRCRFALWMNETDKKVYAALPNHSVPENSRPGGGCVSAG